MPRKWNDGPIEATVADAAWLAGFFDGEGSIGIEFRKKTRNKHPFFVLKATIHNTNRESLERAKRILGFGTIYDQKHLQKGCNKLCHVLMLSALSVERLIRLILPYSTVKREQMELALQFRALGQKKPFEPIADEVFNQAANLAAEIRGINGRHHTKDLLRNYQNGYKQEV